VHLVLVHVCPIQDDILSIHYCIEPSYEKNRAVKWRILRWAGNVERMIYTCMYVCMYVCMDGWMDGWMEGQR
jgi:hypothetical protein